MDALRARMDEIERSTSLRFDDLDKQQGEILRRLDEANGHWRDVAVEIGGVPSAVGRDPSRLSIRHRVHDLENVQHAAVAVNTALGLIFGRTAKTVLVTTSLVAAITSTLRLFGISF